MQVRFLPEVQIEGEYMRKFELRFVESWFSINHVEVKYRTGYFWHHVHYTEPPLLDGEWYTWDRLIYRLSPNRDFEFERKKFSSLQKIQEFEKSQLEILETKNKELEISRDNYSKQLQEALMKANNKI